MNIGRCGHTKMWTNEDSDIVSKYMDDVSDDNPEISDEYYSVSCTT